MSDAPPPAKSPISFRPSDEERETLDRLRRARRISASDVLRQGLELTLLQEKKDEEARRMPFYAMAIDDPRVAEVAEEAASAACSVLDTFMRELGSQHPEKDGIDSNFQGLLGDHLRAMLCGKEFHRKSYATSLKPLFADTFMFGERRYAKDKQGFTLVQRPAKFGEQSLYFHDNGTWVELQKLDVGGLYTSEEAALRGVLGHFERRGMSLREHPMQLALIDFSEDELKHIA